MNEASDELQKWLSTYGKPGAPKQEATEAEGSKEQSDVEQFPVADTFIIQKRPSGFAGLKRLLSSSGSRAPEHAESAN
jgi:hypothetical protein